MKKIKYTIMLISLFLLTGCVKYEANITINNNKSMDYNVIYAIDNSQLIGEEVFTEQQINIMKENKFEVTEYSQNGLSGYNINKKVKNIDNVSSETYVEYNMTKIQNDDPTTKMFQVKKGIFKDRYKAVFKFDVKDSSLLDGRDIASLEQSNTTLDLTFSVHLPHKAISSNSTAQENDGKKLIWDLNNKYDSITFEFETINYKMIIIIVLGIIIGIILFIRYKQGKLIPSKSEEKYNNFMDRMNTMGGNPIRNNNPNLLNQMEERIEYKKNNSSIEDEFVDPIEAKFRREKKQESIMSDEYASLFEEEPEEEVIEEPETEQLTEEEQIHEEKVENTDSEEQVEKIENEKSEIEKFGDLIRKEKLKTFKIETENELKEQKDIEKESQPEKLDNISKQIEEEKELEPIKEENELKIPIQQEQEEMEDIEKIFKEKQEKIKELERLIQQSPEEVSGKEKNNEEQQEDDKFPTDM